MHESDEVIGRALGHRRDSLGLSQQQVADAMRAEGWKWSQATVWAVEKGTRPVRLAEAADLAVILDGTFELSFIHRPVDEEAAIKRLDMIRSEIEHQTTEYIRQLDKVRGIIGGHRPPTLEAMMDHLAADSPEESAEIAAARDERERDVIVAMARFGFGLRRIGEILDLPVAHIRSTLGHAEPAEQEADRG